MDEKKINDVIDINKIAKEIMTTDFKNLNKVEEFGYDVPDYFHPDLEKVEKDKTLDEVVDDLGKLFEKLAKDQNFKLATVIQNFLRRYTYFLATKNDYNEHAQNINAQIIKGHNAAEIFQAVYSPFFNNQIDFYCSDFIAKIKDFEVKKWNANFAQNVENNLNEIIEEKDIVKKLNLMESFLMNYSNYEKVYKELGVEIGGNDADKEAFVSGFNEFKIVLQSTDNLIDKIAKKLQEMVD